MQTEELNYNREVYNGTDTQTQERVLTFIESMDDGNPLFLQKMEQEALEEGIPIIRTQTQSLLKFILEAHRPKRILEVGAATGFSATFMMYYAVPGTEFTTIERDPERAAKARANIARAHESGEVPGAAAITLLEGDAAEIMEELTGPFDLIFMDAAKGQYINFLPRVKDLLAPGGLLVSDNILKEGEILQSRFAVKRRDRTIHKRMRAYLEAITHDESLRTVILQEGDGTAVSVMKR